MRFVPSLPGLAILAFALAAPSAACTNATGTEVGGDPRFDASTTPQSSDEGGCADPNVDAGSGTGWGDLYRDYFGPTATSGCAGAVGQCHGETSALGSQASGYVCAGGASGCYTSMTSAGAGLLVGATPTTTTLYLTLRKACGGGGGSMPKQPASFTFSAADMKRITDWIGAGALNN